VTGGLEIGEGLQRLIRLVFRSERQRRQELIAGIGGTAGVPVFVDAGTGGTENNEDGGTHDHDTVTAPEARQLLGADLLVHFADKGIILVCHQILRYPRGDRHRSIRSRTYQAAYPARQK